MADYDDKPTAQTTVAHWDAEITAYEKAARKWHTDAKKIVERYNLTDSARRSSSGDQWDQGSEFNVSVEQYPNGAPGAVLAHASACRAAPTQRPRPHRPGGRVHA